MSCSLQNSRTSTISVFSPTLPCNLWFITILHRTTTDFKSNSDRITCIQIESVINDSDAVYDLNRYSNLPITDCCWKLTWRQCVGCVTLDRTRLWFAAAAAAAGNDVSSDVMTTVMMWLSWRHCCQVNCTHVAWCFSLRSFTDHWIKVNRKVSYRK